MTGHGKEQDLMRQYQEKIETKLTNSKHGHQNVFRKADLADLPP